MGAADLDEHQQPRLSTNETHRRRATSRSNVDCDQQAPTELQYSLPTGAAGEPPRSHLWASRRRTRHGADRSFRSSLFPEREHNKNVKARPDGIEGPRLRRRAAAFAERRDGHGDQPAAEGEDQGVADLHRAGALVEAALLAGAGQADAAFVDELGGQGAGLEEARAPQPDVGPGGIRRSRRRAGPAPAAGGAAGGRARARPSRRPARRTASWARSMATDARRRSRARRGGARRSASPRRAGSPQSPGPSGSRGPRPALQPSSSRAWSEKTTPPPCFTPARSSSSSRSSCSTGTARPRRRAGRRRRARGARRLGRQAAGPVGGRPPAGDVAGGQGLGQARGPRAAAGPAGRSRRRPAARPGPAGRAAPPG